MADISNSPLPSASLVTVCAMSIRSIWRGIIKDFPPSVAVCLFTAGGLSIHAPGNNAVISTNRINIVNNIPIFFASKNIPRDKSDIVLKYVC